MKRKILVVLVMLITTISFIGCAGGDNGAKVRAVIEAAQKMSKNELYSKAIEELDGKEMSGIGNSSRGATALEHFIAYLQGKKAKKGADGTWSYIEDAGVRAEFPGYKADFSGKITWSQPKENSIFTILTSDSQAKSPAYSMTLIQDGNQIQSKMLDTKILLNYIPKEWAGNLEANGTPFALQSLNKVFMYNNLNSNKKFKNMWDFVATGEAPMFMGVNSEPVGKNFLIMLTQEHYSDIVKAAYLDPANTVKDDALVASMDQKAKDLGLTHESAKYALAWINRYVKQFNEQTDDGPISNELAKNSAAGQSALIVYSKLRSVTETEGASRSNITIAAYQPDYKGVGGYMYKHYLLITKNSPYPYAAAAFIHFMTNSKDGFSAWGADIGGYCSNPSANVDHSNDGGTDIPALNDKGYDWWTGQAVGQGQMVIEDPIYTSKFNTKIGIWIDSLK